MTRLRLVTAVLPVLLLVTASPAQEARPGAAGEPKAGEGGKTTPAGAAGRALLDALEMVAQVGLERDKASPLNLDSFLNRVQPEPQAFSLLAIGKALAGVGNAEAARTALESAADAAVPIDESDAKIDILAQVAEAQAGQGDRDAAAATLQQAAQAIRTFRPGSRIAIAGLSGADPARSKADALRILASAQAKAGNEAAAKKAFDQAIEAAGAIKLDRERFAALLRIAEDRAPADAATVRKNALQSALELAPEPRKIRALEAVLRACVRAGAYDEAMPLVGGTLEGDAKAYALWVVADAMAEAEGDGERQAALKHAGPLLAVAENTPFDRSLKKAAVITRIAQVQAAAGDEDGAYRTLGTIEPDNAALRSRYQVARVKLMTAVARAHLTAGDRNAATNTLQVALEIVSPFPGEGASSIFPLAEIAELQARAGDFRGASRTAEAIDSSANRIDALVRIAAVQTDAGDRDAARKTLQQALGDVGRIPGEELWTRIGYLQPERRASRTPRRGGTGRRSRGTDLRAELGDMTMASSALGKIAAARAKARDFAGALETAASIANDDFSGRRERQSALEAIAEIRAKAGDFPGARETAESIPVEDALLASQKDPLLEAIAREQAKAGDAAGVLAWARATKRPATRLAMIRGMADGIAEGLDKGGKTEGPTKP